MFQSIYTTIKTDICKSLGKGLGWVIDSVIDHAISISKYNPLAGSSYKKLPKYLDHPRRGLINIPDIDDSECFRWCLVRYLNSANHHPEIMEKADKDFVKTLDFKDINFLLKLKDIQKIENKNSIDISVFGYENKEKYRIYVPKKCCKWKHFDLSLIGEEEQKHHVLITDFNRFTYDH